MRRNFAKKAISLLLMAAMLSTMLPVNTFAASGEHIFEQEKKIHIQIKSNRLVL